MRDNNVLGVDEDDEREEEDEERVGVLQVHVPHLERDAQVAHRREQAPQLQHTRTHSGLWATIQVHHRQQQASGNTSSKFDVLLVKGRQIFTHP